MHGRTTVFEAIALLPANGKCRLAFMQNPLQCPPSEYGEARVRNPRFSRAAGVLAGNAGLLFVSGTASVRGRRIAGGNDAVAQTRATLENMAALMAAELLVERHGWPRPVTWADFRQIRVYVKTGAMLAAVKRCCQETFPGVPQLYLQADVCLPDALVEIEGVAAIRGS